MRTYSQVLNLRDLTRACWVYGFRRICQFFSVPGIPRAVSSANPVVSHYWDAR